MARDDGLPSHLGPNPKHGSTDGRPPVEPLKNATLSPSGRLDALATDNLKRPRPRGPGYIVVLLHPHFTLLSHTCHRSAFVHQLTRFPGPSPMHSTGPSSRWWRYGDPRTQQAGTTGRGAQASSARVRLQLLPVEFTPCGSGIVFGAVVGGAPLCRSAPPGTQTHQFGLSLADTHHPHGRWARGGAGSDVIDSEAKVSRPTRPERPRRALRHYLPFGPHTPNHPSPSNRSAAMANSLAHGTSDSCL